MVDTLASRLAKLKGDMPLEKFGAIAGKSAQAAQKWFHGGKMKDSTAAKYARHFNVTVAWIQHGEEQGGLHIASEPPPPGGLSALAVDIARRWMSLSAERQDWFRDLIFTMAFVEKRFPAMRKGRPKGESYDNLELAFERDMRQLKLKLE